MLRKSSSKVSKSFLKSQIFFGQIFYIKFRYVAKISFLRLTLKQNDLPKIYKIHL